MALFSQIKEPSRKPGRFRIHFTDVMVAPEYVLGSPFAGMSVAADTMSSGRIAIAAVAAGAIWRLLQLMVRYTRRRSIGGASLYASDHVAARIANSWQAAQVNDAMVYGIASKMDQGVALPTEIHAAAKLVSTECLWRAADDAMQLLGGRAYCENNPVARIWRDARITRVFEGPSETIALYLGQQIGKAGGPFRSYLEQASRSSSVWAALATLLPSAKEPFVNSSSQYLIALGKCVGWAVAGIFSQDNAAQSWIVSQLASAARKLTAASSVPFPDALTLDRFISQRIGEIALSEVAGHTTLDDYLQAGN